jgi:hypothetical protein
MKVIKKIIFAVAIVMVQGCDDEFLNVSPKDQVVGLKTYSNFLTYADNFYGTFQGYARGPMNTEFNGDLFLNSVPNGESDWVWGRVIIPSASANWDGPYTEIRNINIMLDALEGSNLTEVESNHWRAVGYFFRCFQYADLVNKYGDVPLVTKALTDEDTDELYATRTPRNEVTTKILEDLIWAEANIKPAGDGPNTINVHAVRALISRFGLTEGTWRKYHGLTDADTYLRASVDAAEKLMIDFPALHPNYDEVFNSASLAGVPGIILYKQYEANQITNNLSTGPASSNGRWDLTKKAVDMYLMTDGETRWASALFDGDKTAYDEFRNRDRRLYFTVPPPYKINAAPQSFTFEHTDNPADREYFPLMESLSDEKHKQLPTTNWQGILVVQEPHFQQDNKGQPFSVTYTGYRCYKFYNKLNLGISSLDIHDAPVFRMGEVLMNYAEAKYELGEFDQAVAAATINKLRARGGVVSLDLNVLPVDPTIDPAVDPVLWEIRRERAIELMGEGFRWDDLRRWKKMDYTSKKKLGRWITRAEVARVPIENGASEGYIDYFGTPPAFQEHYYLHPIPSDQIVLNPNLIQNPGWE